MPTFPKTRPGDSIRRHVTSKAWNTIVDALNDPRGQPIAAPDPFRGNNATRILVRANAAYGRFEIVGLSAPLILPSANVDEFQSRVAFLAATPAAAHQFKFAILQEPLATDAIGTAIVDGVTPCVVNVTSSAHQYADVKAGDKTRLASGPIGAAQILWRETISTYPASVQAVVRLGVPTTPLILGKTVAAHNKGTIGQVYVYSGIFPNEQSLALSDVVLAVNRFANVGASKWVACAWLNGNWYMVCAECA
jgi:hypothetical protein